MPFHPMVLVEWNDAHGSASEQWFEGGEIEHFPLVVHTLGYLAIDDDVGVTMWQEMAAPDGSSYRGRGFIPRAMIKSITYLSNKPAKRARKAKTPTVS